MKLIFAGTPEFAAEALVALVAAKHEIALVLTQPDRPAGRGQALRQSAVAQQAAALGLQVAKPVNLKSAETQQMLRDCAAEVMVVAAYGQLLPPAVLAIPARGCLNIHASLLPRWRGAAPIQRAIEAGDAETGITIMQMDVGLDTGHILVTRTTPIAADDTAASLVARLAKMGARAIVDTLAAADSLMPVAQANDGVCYAKKIEKSEARIDWTQPASIIERRLRAFDPFPGAEARFADASLKIWRARVVPGQRAGEPGEVIAQSPTQLCVQCGVDALSLEIVQRPGGTRQAIAAYLRGTAMLTGARFA